MDAKMNMANDGIDGVDEEDQTWSDWEDEGDVQGGFLPLGVSRSSDGDKTFKSIADAIQFDKVEHAFDFPKVVEDLRLGFYDCMKLINFIRKEVSAGKGIPPRSAIEQQQNWKDDQYLIPVLEDDSLLLEIIDFLKLNLDEEQEQGRDGDEGSDSSSLLRQENEDLKRLVSQLRETVIETGNALTQETTTAVQKKEKEILKEKNMKIDKNYFNSYSQFGIHMEMLSDKARMLAYRSSIEMNEKKLINGKDVLDVGCGTGILSLLCARSGARHVCAVDGSAKIATIAKSNIEENGYRDVIGVYSGMIEENILPVDYKCDVIISEWMGYGLLYESMLYSVLYARDKYLREGGCVLPDKASLWMAACDESAFDLPFWDDVEGFSMKAVAQCSLKEDYLKKAHVKHVQSNSLITDAAPIKAFDICTMSASDAQHFSSEFQFSKAKNAAEGRKCSALVVWFDTDFSETYCDIPVCLTTSPHKEGTHWAQTLLGLPEPVAFNEDQPLKGRISFQQHTEDFRSLDITLEYGAKADGTFDTVVHYELV